MSRSTVTAFSVALMARSTFVFAGGSEANADPVNGLIAFMRRTTLVETRIS